MLVALRREFEQDQKGSTPRINRRLGEGQVDRQINQKVTVMLLMAVKEEYWETGTSPCMLQINMRA